MVEECMRSTTGKLRWIAIGLGASVAFLAGAIAFTRVPPEPAAIAATAAAPPIEGEAPELGPPRFAETLDVSTFQRGNIHTHSSWSDGDRPPKSVYAWYRRRGYAFVAITDHENRISPKTFRELERKDFVIIAGEEVTMTVKGKPVHVNGLCTKKTIGGSKFRTNQAALLHGIDEVHAQGGVALVNHPNFEWTLSLDDIRVARGAELIEIWSGHPDVHNEGDAERPSHETIWDTLLDEGFSIAGVAVDDAHTFGVYPFTAARKKKGLASRPGKGWVQVFAEKPERAAICDALTKGRLYASSGVTLDRIRVADDKLAVWPREEGALVEFVGTGGKILAKTERGPEGDASYTVRGDERWVRARITTPDGKMAWTQAYRIVR